MPTATKKISADIKKKESTQKPPFFKQKIIILCVYFTGQVG